MHRSVAETSGIEGRCSALAWPEHVLIVSFGVIIVAVSTLWQQRWGVIPDTSWLIYVTERVLAGDRLYVDVIETNPPFSIWLYLPAVWLAQHLGIPGEAAVHGFTRLAAVAGLAGAGLIAYRAGFLGNAWLVRLSPVLLALLILFPGNAFSERDHIAAALFLPFLILVAWRATGDGPSRPDIATALMVGLMASPFVLVKPHYALIVLALSVYLWMRIGFVAMLKLPELWTIGVLCVAYAAAVLALYPQFIFELYPLLSETYLQVTARDRAIRFVPGWLIPVVLTWWIGGKPSVPVVAGVSLIASVAAVFVALLQGKGWAYHFYPALLFAFVALAVVIAERLGSIEESRKGNAARLAITVCAVVACWVPFSASQKPDVELVAAIRANYDSPKVASIATDIAVGHPLTPMLGGRWISAHHGDWLGGYTFLLRERARRAEDNAGFTRYDALLQEYIQGKREEFGVAAPDILLVQKSNPVWWTVLENEFGFAELMTGYEFLAEDSLVEVYRRIE